jgi:predicted transposase YdaD
VAKPFDVTLKHLVEAYASDCLDFVDLRSRKPVDVIDADLSTVIAEADKVIRVHDPTPWLVHLEFQASYDPDLSDRLLRYNVLLNGRHGIPVRSVVVLLRPEADGSAMTGIVSHVLPEGERYLEFRYTIVRVWQKAVESVLKGGLGTLPLAPLAKVERKELPSVIDRMKERITSEATIQESSTLWVATYLLMGLRFSLETASQMLQGVQAMKESVTYQAILAEGKAEGKAEGSLEEARKLLLRLGSKRFGRAHESALAAIQTITDLRQLEDLSDKLFNVSSWDELLRSARLSRGNGKRKRSSK